MNKEFVYVFVLPPMHIKTLV